MKKYWIWIAIAVVVIIAIVLMVRKTKSKQKAMGIAVTEGGTVVTTDDSPDPDRSPVVTQVVQSSRCPCESDLDVQSLLNQYSNASIDKKQNIKSIILMKCPCLSRSTYFV